VLSYFVGAINIKNMRQIILIFALMICVGAPNFARVTEPVKLDWLQMWTHDGEVTMHNDGDPCHMTSIIEYADGSFHYTVIGLCFQNNPYYGVDYYYGVQ
jgi:hypothetical protein